MKMSEHLPQTDWLETELTSMSSAEGSPAKTLATQASVLDSQGSDPAYGMNSTDSLKKSNRATRSLRTYQPFAIADWTLYSGASLRSGMTLNGTVYPLQPLALLTAATASGLWPIPTANRSNQCSVDAAGHRMWPTPRASEWKGTGPLGSKSHIYRLKKGYLDASVQEAEQRTGKLNPTWVEWLMGFPPGWTDLKPSEMPSSRRSQKSSAKR